MKKVLCAAALAMAATTTPATAELPKVFACQYTDSNGFHYDGSWKRTGFNLRPPFFIKTNGETITSAGHLFEESISCTQRNSLFQCGDELGSIVFFNVGTKRGGAADLFGATNDGDSRDTVQVSLFVCQVM